MCVPGGFENFFRDLDLTKKDQNNPKKEYQVLLHLLEKKYGEKSLFE